MKKGIIVCLLICFCVGLSPGKVLGSSTVNAVEPIDISAKASLTAIYAYDGTFLPEIRVSLYQVAMISENFQYVLTDRFEETKLAINGLKSAHEWDTVRSTLESFIMANGLAPSSEKLTGHDGTALFNALAPGLYLMMPAAYQLEDGQIRFDSALVSVPGLQEDGTWEYDITVKPKPGFEPEPDGTKKYKVIKLWRDKGNEKNRPAAIEADILRNAQVDRSIRLSEENQWCYSWEAPDNGDVWTVAEKNVPHGYTGLVEKHENSFVLINEALENSTTPSTGDSANLGLYIILLSISCLLLVLLGMAMRRRYR